MRITANSVLYYAIYSADVHYQSENSAIHLLGSSRSHFHVIGWRVGLVLHSSSMPRRPHEIVLVHGENSGHSNTQSGANLWNLTYLTIE